VDTYCKTVMIARQLGTPINEIPADKIADLLAIKKRLGLPDPRLAAGETVKGSSTAPAAPQGEEIDQLVSALTSQVMKFLENKG
jgi:L-fuculose-phosphate aldolase